MEPKHEFTGVFIPAHVWLNPDLTPSEKMLIAEIHALGGHDGSCFASNAHFGKSLHVSERGIGKMLSKLKRVGLLEEKDFDGRKRWLRTLNMGGNPKRVEPQFQSDTNSSSSQSGTPVLVCMEPQFQHKVQDESTRGNERLNKTVEIQFPDELNTPEFRQLWSEWCHFRKELGKKLTPTSIRRQIAQLSEVTPNVARQMLEQSMTNGWQGLFPPTQTKQNKPLKNYQA